MSDGIRSKEGYVQTQVQSKTGWITFYHPAHNALPGHLLKQLEVAIIDLDQHPDVTVMVLQSAGERTFCAGANLQELAAIQDPESATAFFMGFARVINAMRKSRKPVIGRVQGKAVGGGVGLIAATDYCMATKWASVRLSEISLGIGPFVIEPALRRKIGVASVSKLALHSGEWQTAKWAKEQGLFQDVFDEAEQMNDYLQRYLSLLSSYDLTALAAMKAILWEGTGDWDQLLAARARQSGTLLLSAFTQNKLKEIISSSKKS